MRDWLAKDAPEEKIVRTVAAGAAAMTRTLLGEAEGAKQRFDD